MHILSPLEQVSLQDSNALRSYSVTYRIVANVDNQGGQCQYCGDEGQLVVANVYATDWDGDTHCVDTCSGCIVYVIDGGIDIDPNTIVIVEIAQGAK